MIKNKFKEMLSKISRDFSIDLMFLFGSQRDKGLSILKGEEVDVIDPLADMDIGVVFKKESFPQKPYKVFGPLYFELCEVFSPLKIDLVFLQETESTFQFEAIKGVCIHKSDQEILENYIEYVLKFAADWKVFRDRIDREFLGIGGKYGK
ncbi:MAG: hypothetical protein SCARUB_01909 [Candidatus Scalindua rubra]|uniref:Polymerase beta nucleotidyltransferase domain-containing protein n=1 Tax=Candidatus Scalindua rubra TaxID=1872076 RepID=A0A1E3XBJ4_9BACT|nr:MAG: hypothetical protein SCARUB_01909 [Candidatus Scalindua rubra]